MKMEIRLIKVDKQAIFCKVIIQILFIHEI